MNQANLDLIRAKTELVDLSQVETRVWATLGPGWRDDIVSPETISCFYLTWIVTEGGRPGRAVSGNWIGWN